MPKNAVSLSLIIMFLSCGSIGRASEPIATCANEKLGIKGVSNKRLGPYWEYSYRGQSFAAAEIEAVVGGAAVQFTGEQVISGDERQVTHSIRKVVLRDPSGKVVIKADVECRGYLAPLAVWGD